MRAEPELTGEIVGREGLATTVSAVAAQLSSLEKATTSGFSALREEIRLEFSTMRLDLKRVENAENARHDHHETVHSLESKALNKAQEVNEIRQAGQNEWREESQQRQLTYVQKTEWLESIKRLEALIERGSSDLSKAITGPSGINERLKANEDFIISVKAQLGTIKALIVLVPILLAVVAFVIARSSP